MYADVFGIDFKIYGILGQSVRYMNKMFVNSIIHHEQL